MKDKIAEINYKSLKVGPTKWDEVDIKKKNKGWIKLKHKRFECNTCDKKASWMNLRLKKSRSKFFCGPCKKGAIKKEIIRYYSPLT